MRDLEKLSWTSAVVLLQFRSNYCFSWVQGTNSIPNDLTQLTFRLQAYNLDQRRASIKADTKSLIVNLLAFENGDWLVFLKPCPDETKNVR